MIETMLPGDFYLLKDQKTVVRVWGWDSSGAVLGQINLTRGDWAMVGPIDVNQVSFKLSGGVSRAYRCHTLAEARARKEEIEKYLDRALTKGIVGPGGDWLKDLKLELDILKALWPLEFVRTCAGARPAVLLGALVRPGGLRQELWEYTMKNSDHTALRLITTGRHKDFQGHTAGYYEMRTLWLQFLVNNGVEWAGRSYKGQAPTVLGMLRARTEYGANKKHADVRAWLEKNGDE